MNKIENEVEKRSQEGFEYSFIDQRFEKKRLQLAVNRINILFDIFSYVGFSELELH